MPDTTMAEVGRGMALSQAGERDAARRVLGSLWEDIGGEDGGPLTGARSRTPWPTCRTTRPMS